jgi:fatty acid synthase
LAIASSQLGQDFWFSAGRSGNIRWCNNWVAFMDNMLQTDILSEDTRGLFVPTSLQKLTIDTKQHIAILHSLAAENNEVGEPL